MIEQRIAALDRQIDILQKKKKILLLQQEVKSLEAPVKKPNDISQPTGVSQVVDGQS